ncbi:MAG: GAF domain-containing protein [Chloroflexi bacterium]|nr:GAF domain-containing protein [Chloroflexota bacterium]
MAETIMVVEDDPIIAELLAGLLGTEGYSAILVDSGESALQILKGRLLGLEANRQKVDLILLDILLPGIDGYKVCHTVKDDPNLKYIPVIMLTARASTSDRVLGLELGANDYISKPFECAEVVARIKSTLRASRMERELLQRNKELAAINIIATTTEQSLDLEEVLHLALDTVLEVTGLEAGGIMLLDAEEETLSYHIWRGLSAEFVSGVAGLKLGEGIAGRVALSGEPILTEDISADPRLTRYVVRKEGLQCFASVPLKSKNRVLGVLCIGSRSGCKLSSADADLLNAIGNQIGIALDNAQVYRKLRTGYLNTIRSLSKAIDARDPHTMGHSEMVARGAVLTGKKLGLSRDELELIECAGLLHDVGKIGTREAVLLKDGELDPQEREEMRRHVIVGKEILEPISELRRIVPWVYHHHEYYDGTGYPSALKGQEIPLAARILAVVDSYCAMLSDRPYSAAWTKERAIQEVRQGAGTQFDPTVVRAFVEAMEEDFDGLEIPKGLIVTSS